MRVSCADGDQGGGGGGQRRAGGLSSKPRLSDARDAQSALAGGVPARFQVLSATLSGQNVVRQLPALVGLVAAAQSGALTAQQQPRGTDPVPPVQVPGGHSNDDFSPPKNIDEMVFKLNRSSKYFEFTSKDLTSLKGNESQFRI